MKFEFLKESRYSDLSRKISFPQSIFEFKFNLDTLSDHAKFQPFSIFPVIITKRDGLLIF